MPNLVFEDRNGKLCSIFDSSIIRFVYTHLDFHEPPTELLEKTIKEIQEISKNRTRYENSEFLHESKDFLINQSNNVILHLRRLKRFLEEGIDKDYKLVVE